MSTPGPREAAASLADVRRRQDTVVAAVAIPGWYWATVAMMTLVVGVAADSDRPALVAGAVTACVLIVGTATCALIFGFRRRPRIHHDVLGRDGALSIDVFVLAVVGSTLAIGFGLRAAGTAHPATVATAIAAMELLSGGPLLMRRLTRIMHANSVGALHEG